MSLLEEQVFLSGLHSVSLYFSVHQGNSQLFLKVMKILNNNDTNMMI